MGEIQISSVRYSLLRFLIQNCGILSYEFETLSHYDFFPEQRKKKINSILYLAFLFTMIQNITIICRFLIQIVI